MTHSIISAVRTALYDIAADKAWCIDEADGTVRLYPFTGPGGTDMRLEWHATPLLVISAISRSEQSAARPADWRRGSVVSRYNKLLHHQDYVWRQLMVVQHEARIGLLERAGATDIKVTDNVLEARLYSTTISWSIHEPDPMLNGSLIACTKAIGALQKARS